MDCALCGRPGPADQDTMIDDGWIPYYYAGPREMPGPVCPDCRQRELHLASDGEWATTEPPPDFYRWN